MDKNDPRRQPTEAELADVNDHWQEPDELNEHVYDPGDPDGVVAAEQQPAPVATTRRRKRRWPWVLLLIVIAAAAAGAYAFGTHKSDKSTPKTTQTAQPKVQQSTQATTPTKHYDSTNFTLGFDYPATWTVNDTTSKLTVTSPDIQLIRSTGSKAATHVVVAIQNQQSTIAGYPASGAAAVVASDKLTYKQPTTIQRAQTYLSYLGYSAASNLDALFITGDNGYQQGQTIPMSDVVKGNPLISVAFASCATPDCATGTPTPVSLQATDWKSSAASKDVTSLLESIQLD